MKYYSFNIKNLLVITVILLSCNQHKQPSTNHQKRLELTEKFPDSLFFKIPDSLKPVAALLRTVHTNDQKFRDIENPYYLDENKQEQLLLDSINRKIIDSLINIYGILSYKQVGLIGYKSIMAVLIHSDTSLKVKYFDLVKNAFKEKKIFATHYTLFIDKYLAQTKRLQLYGTQYITYKGKMVPYPFDVTQINNNRKKAGLSVSGDFFTNKTTLLKADVLDSSRCAALFPEIIKQLKIDTSSNKNFASF
jgi:hypothetical protein